MQVLLERLNDKLRYNDLADTYGGWGMIFFIEESRYTFGEGWGRIPRVWLTDHNVENYEIGKTIIVREDRFGYRAHAHIIAAVNPKMAKRMAEQVKDALRENGLRADTLIDVCDRLDPRAYKEAA